MTKPAPGSGYLPPGATTVFAEAIRHAQLYDKGSPERVAIFDMAHARVRFLYPDFFKGDPHHGG